MVFIEINSTNYNDIYHKFKEKENSIGKLPIKILENILSFTDNRDLYSIAKLNYFWRQTTLDFVKERKFCIIKNFANLIHGKLNAELYNEQKKRFLSISSLKTSKIKVDSPEKLSKIISHFKHKKIKKILSSIDEENLNKIFDSFKGVKKPKIFYEFSLLSKKYQKLNKDLTYTIYFSHKNRIPIDLNKIKKLLEEGAKPASKNLHYALFNSLLVKMLLQAGAVPTYGNLHAATEVVDYEVSLEAIKDIVEAMRDSKEEILNEAIEWNQIKLIKLLLEAGIKPTEKNLKTATDSKLDSQTIQLLATAIPTEKTM